MEKRWSLLEPNMLSLRCVMRAVTWERISASDSGSTTSYVVSSTAVVSVLPEFVKDTGPVHRVVLVSSVAGTDLEP